MKSAKEMFEELGFNLISGAVTGLLIAYQRIKDNKTTVVTFDLTTRRYGVYNVANSSAVVLPVGVRLHKAINKQIEELGWIE